MDKNDPNKRKVKEPHFLKRILTGKELLHIFQHVAFIYRDYDEPVNDEECALIADIFQYFSDLIDMYGDLEVSDLIKEGMALIRKIAELKDNGYYVYAESHKVKLAGEPPMVYNTCTIILRKLSGDGIFCVYD